MGENGAGKTMLVNDIMYTIRDAEIFGKNHEDFQSNEQSIMRIASARIRTHD